MTAPATKKGNPWTVKIAMWSAAHRWLVFGLWFVATLSIFAVGLIVGTRTSDITGNSGGTPKTEAARANAAINADRATNAPTVATQDFYFVITNPTVKYTDPAFKDKAGKLIADLKVATYTKNGTTAPVFSKVNDYYAFPVPQLGSADGTTIRLQASSPGTRQEVRPKYRTAIEPLIKKFRADNPGFTLFASSNLLVNDEFDEVLNGDLDGSLKITLPLTFGILLITFGAVIASLVPLVLAGTALAAAFGILAIYSQTVTPVNPSSTQLIILIGLAVGIDYSLFMITRYRTERRHGRDKLKAIEVASSTAGRAVFFSGLTVMISLAGLFFIDDPIFSSMAVGTISVVLIAVLGSLTFLPATLSLLGHRIDWLRIPYFGRDREEGTGFWSKLVATVTRRPIMFITVVVVVLLVLALPTTRLNLGSTTGLDGLPDSMQSIQGYKLMNAKWPQGTDLTMTVAVKANAPDRADVKAAVEKFKTEALKVGGLNEPVTIDAPPGSKVTRIVLTMAGSANSETNRAIVRQVRGNTVPANFGNLPGVEVFVGGSAASVMDTAKIYTDALPAVFAFVLGLSFLLLLVAFRSLIIPIKAIILNLLSTGTAYGVLVLVFQEGWLGDVLNIKSTGVIESFVPLFLFTILFGLSMDYHLFVLTRIKEARDRGATSNEAVAKGISITSRTITSAAAIMVAVFAVFVTLEITVVRQLGLGLAVAVFVDATIIRCILLPATMRLLGDWNWWLPKWLGWLPHVTIEAEEDDEPVAKPAEPVEAV